MDLETMATRNPSLIVERDELLHHLGIFRPQFFSPARNPTQITSTSTPVRFRVQDSNGAPIGNADIIVYGSIGSEDQGKTNAQGTVTVTIPVTAPFLNQVAALYVKPPANYWEQFLERPRLDPQGVNMITLQPLSSYARAGFPGQAGSPFVGWGQEIMGLPNLVPLQSGGERANGEQIRVAIIDSGCDVTHPALDHIRIGRDYTNLTNNQPDEETWKNDPLSHGTHCAGNGRVLPACALDRKDVIC
jgi:subtilisin